MLLFEVIFLFFLTCHITCVDPSPLSGAQGMTSEVPLIYELTPGKLYLSYYGEANRLRSEVYIVKPKIVITVIDASDVEEYVAIPNAKTIKIRPREDSMIQEYDTVFNIVSESLVTNRKVMFLVLPGYEDFTFALVLSYIMRRNVFEFDIAREYLETLVGDIPEFIDDFKDDLAEYMIAQELKEPTANEDEVDGDQIEAQKKNPPNPELIDPMILHPDSSEKPKRKREYDKKLEQARKDREAKKSKSGKNDDAKNQRTTMTYVFLGVVIVCCLYLCCLVFVLVILMIFNSRKRVKKQV